MGQSTIEATIRKSNRQYLTHFFVIIIGLVIAIALSHNYLYNFFMGPFEVTEDYILNYEPSNDPTEEYFITINDVLILDTGYEYYTEYDDGREVTEQSYGAIVINAERFLLVESPDLIDESETTHTGYLSAIPDDINREVIQDIEYEEPDLKDVFLPYMLKKDDFRLPGYIGLAVGGALLIYAFLALSWSMSRGSDIKKHPIMKKLSRYGDPEMILDNIENEMMMQSEEVGKLIFTRNWIVYNQGNVFEAIANKDIMWAYKKVTQNKYGKTYSAHILDRHGNHIQFNGKEIEVDNSLQGINSHTPWALVGYDKKLQQEWNSNQANVIAVVDKRYQDYRNQGTM